MSLFAYIQELIRADDAACRGATGGITELIGVLGDEGKPTDIARDKHAMVAEALDSSLDTDESLNQKARDFARSV